MPSIGVTLAVGLPVALVIVGVVYFKEKLPNNKFGGADIDQVGSRKFQQP
ncbi:hypothetical protein [Wolbachia endosymbiont of Pentidionis agamae]